MKDIANCMLSFGYLREGKGHGGRDGDRSYTVLNMLCFTVLNLNPCIYYIKIKF